MSNISCTCWPSLFLGENVCWDFCSFLFIYLFCSIFMAAPAALGVQSELQLPAYTTPTATSDLSLVCDLHHSSWQCQILNTLSKARDQTLILIDISLVNYQWAIMGTPFCSFLIGLFGRFFFHWVVWVLYIFWTLRSYPINSLQIFSPILYFHFVNCFIYWA